MVLPFKTTKNEAKYEALIVGLGIAKWLSVAYLKVYRVSQLVVNQVRGEYLAKDEHIKKFLKEAKAMVEGSTNFEIEAIPREANMEVDTLSKYVWHPTQSIIHFIECIACPCVYECFNVHATPNWATPIRKFFKTGVEPQDEAEARRMSRLAPSYTLIVGILYKKEFSTPLLRCITPSKMMTCMKDMPLVMKNKVNCLKLL